ncbi:MAG TPA: NUDIX domain-containing protein [Acidimicrobiales bacterium]|nr:NUDIX domain-containing protein [Acidimicrobiales bacterium]
MMDNVERPDEIVTAVLVGGGKVLLCLRSRERRWFPGVWDFPGGHVEPGESPNAALVREIREELAVVIFKPAREPDHHLVTSDFDMKIWTVDKWEGTPTNASPPEHDAIGWFTMSESRSLHLAHERYFSIIETTLSRQA